MAKKGFGVVGVIVLLVILAVLGGGAYYYNIEKKFDDTALELPALYPNFRWGQENVDNFRNNNKPVLFFGNEKFEKDKTKQKSGDTTLAGTEWHFGKTNLTSLERDEGFNRYYDAEFSRMGWGKQSAANGFLFRPLFDSEGAADSPSLSMKSYIKIANGKARMVVFSYEADGKALSYEADIPKFICPCSETYRVFASNIVSINEIISSARDNREL